MSADNRDEQAAYQVVASYDLEAELASAYAELEAVQEAVRSLPEVYEAKFRHFLAVNIQLNRYLLLRNKELEGLVNKQRIVFRSASLLGNSNMLGFWVGLLGTRCRKPAKYFGTVCLGIVIACFASWKFNQIYAAKTGVQDVPVGLGREIARNTIKLRSDGPSWVEVQDLMTREVLFIGEMQAGRDRTIVMRQGVRIRSGRPDLLTVSIDGAPPTPFGNRQGLGWRTFKSLLKNPAVSAKMGQLPS